MMLNNSKQLVSGTGLGFFDNVQLITEKFLTFRAKMRRIKREKRKSKNQLLDWIEAFLWAACMVLLINQYLVQAYRIPSGSMIDSLNIGDHVFVNKLVYGPELLPGFIKLPSPFEPKRNDIVIFESPAYISRGTVFDIAQRVIYMLTLSLVDIDRDERGEQRVHFLIKRNIGQAGDHFKTENYKSDRWQAMIRSKENVRSFADNYTKEFVNRYKNNPYLWSIDLMNEPEWISEGEGMNPFADRISWKDLQYFFAYNSAVIRENSNILITVGIGYAKYNVDGNGFDGNMVSDAALKAQYNNKNAYIDFWSPHYYDWVGEWYGVAHYLNPYGSRQGSRTAGYHGGMGLNPSKPAVIAECSAKGTSGSRRFIRPEDQPPGANTIITDFEYAYLNGWQGVMPWTSNYIDGNGGLSDMAPATKYMLEKYRNLIFPFDD